ncbi:RHS repeat-associated core domain-containing protein [Streptomyces sp. NPDC003300]|uniref:RHS repeat-associated core domain-containing protein n=1 Tax=unclassified Streptomyces TaxID=2593676 RepID=UPI0033BF2B19
MEFINQSTVTSTVYQYDPYGAYQTTTATGSAAAQNPYRFVGGTYDRTTGWIKYGQRWYNPTTGRFTSQDAHSFLADPAQGNRYAYAGDDPINNVDPTGEVPWSKYATSCFKGGAQGALVAGLTGTATTGIGLATEAATGCAIDTGLDIVGDYGPSGSGDASEAVSFLNDAKDAFKLGASLF